MIDADAIRYRWETVGCKLDERGRRMFAAAEVRTGGWGGLAVVSRITGLARSTINRGEDDLDAEPLPRGQAISVQNAKNLRAGDAAVPCKSAASPIPRLRVPDILL